jgi:hypothetical protein
MRKRLAIVARSSPPGDNALRLPLHQERDTLRTIIERDILPLGFSRVREGDIPEYLVVVPGCGTVRVLITLRFTASYAAAWQIDAHHFDDLEKSKLHMMGHDPGDVRPAVNMALKTLRRQKAHNAGVLLDRLDNERHRQR